MCLCPFPGHQRLDQNYFHGEDGSEKSVATKTPEKSVDRLGQIGQPGKDNAVEADAGLSQRVGMATGKCHLGRDEPQPTSNGG